MKDHGLSRSELLLIIDEWVFSARNREILKRRMLDGLTYEELAGEFNLSPQAIKSIVYKNQERVFSHI